MKTIIAAMTIGLGALSNAATAQQVQTLPAVVAIDTAADVLTVQNDRKAPALVYMEDRSTERRLGEVPGNQTAALPLPAWAVRHDDTIQLVIEPEGYVEDLETPPFTLSPPGRVATVIPPWGVSTAVDANAMTAVLPPADLDETTITVDNPRTTPVSIYVERYIADRDIGTVPAHGEATLVVPRSMVSPQASLRIFVQPKYGFELSSDFLNVMPGEHLGLRVPID